MYDSTLNTYQIIDLEDILRIKELKNYHKYREIFKILNMDIKEEQKIIKKFKLEFFIILYKKGDTKFYFGKIYQKMIFNLFLQEEILELENNKLEDLKKSFDAIINNLITNIKKSNKDIIFLFEDEYKDSEYGDYKRYENSSLNFYELIEFNDEHKQYFEDFDKKIKDKDSQMKEKELSQLKSLLSKHSDKLEKFIDHEVINGKIKPILKSSKK